MCKKLKQRIYVDTQYGSFVQSVSTIVSPFKVGKMLVNKFLFNLCYSVSSVFKSDAHTLLTLR